MTLTPFCLHFEVQYWPEQATAFLCQTEEAIFGPSAGRIFHSLNLDAPVILKSRKVVEARPSRPGFRT
jgi:hypothetical protein